MKDRQPSLVFGRVVCLTLLIAGMLVKSTVGKALVWHQHGRLIVHFHVVGPGDGADLAANSPAFGHQQLAGSRSGDQDVRTILIIATGLVFVSEDRDHAQPASRECWCPIPGEILASPHRSRLVDSIAIVPALQLRKSAATSSLLRNHSLLI